MNEYADRVKEVLTGQIKIESAIKGNVVRVTTKASRGEFLFIVFDDSRWACYEVEHGLDGDVEIQLCSYHSFDSYHLREAELLTENEYQEQKDMETAGWKEIKKQRDLKELQRLKAKYE